MKNVHIIVQGLVQGVFFRQTTKEKAIELGVTGFVRNLPDGTVEIEAQGDEEAVEKLISWCYHGPDKARVTHIDIHQQGLKKYSSFTIMR